ncbi:hypothetical protein LUZ60_010061 [Juncus effusus]|nr:hypothetical protein LUZ60_010061 [Juncus effusus]
MRRFVFLESLSQSQPPSSPSLTVSHTHHSEKRKEKRSQNKPKSSHIRASRPISGEAAAAPLSPQTFSISVSTFFASAMPSKKRSGKKKSKSPPNPQSEPIPNEPAADSRARDLEWLSGAFSSLSTAQIESVYDETGQDPFKAAGILGTQLDQEDGEEDPGADSTISELSSSEPSSSGSSTLSESSSSSSDPGIRPTVSEGSPSPRKGKKARPKTVTISCGMVSNVIGKGYVSNNNLKEKSSAMEGERGVERNLEEAEGFLCSILGDGSELGVEIVRDVLVQCGGQVEKALEALLELSDSNYSQKMNERNLNFTNNTRNYLDYATVLKRNPNSYQLADKASCQYDRQTRPEMQQKVLESLFHVRELPKYEPAIMDWRRIVKKLQPTAEESQSIPAVHQNHKNGNGYYEFRTVAQQNWERMKDYYQQAAHAYSRGNRGHASILAEKGKYYRDLARQEDEKASLEIFGARNKEIKNTVTIDLHGQHVKQAIALLKRHLLLFACVPSVHYLRVITGCGLDGVGKGKLKRSAISLVEREGLKWSEENSGTIMLNIEGHKEYSFVDPDSDCDL